MNREPLVSIIIPVYNAEKYLDYCIGSILQQTYQHIELILVDDGSSDSSPVMCDEYARKDKRIVVVHTENGGVSKARNIGLQRASGDYIMFVDNDDALPHDAVKLYVSTAISENVDIIQGRIGVWEGNASVSEQQDGRGSFQLFSVEEFVKDGINRTGVWGKLYKASVAKRHSFPVGYYGEDLYYNARYLTDESIENAGILDSVTYLRYLHPESASSLWGIEDYYKNTRIVEDILREVKLKSKNQKIIDQYIKLFYSQLCKNKYMIVLRKGYTKSISNSFRQFRTRHIMELWNSGLEIKYKIILSFFSVSNAAYRLWLLYTDPTMKAYEKSIVSKVTPEKP